MEQENVATPAGAIKAATGVFGTNQGLPGDQPTNPIIRPKKVHAVITSTSTGDEKRAKSDLLTNVTAMARAEQRILLGADIYKFYDAGHLVGDQLVKGEGAKKSFEYWNLAPQISKFNTPAYSQIEKQIWELARKKDVDMTVELAYTNDNYTVSVGDLMKRGIIKKEQLRKKNTPEPSLEVVFPRRIPNEWHLHAEVVEQGTGASVLPKPHFINPPPTPTLSPSLGGSTPLLPATTPPHLSKPVTNPAPVSLGQPFTMVPSMLNTKLMSHTVTGRQWSPSTVINPADILSLLRSTFTDLKDANQIAKMILNPEQDEVTSVKVAALFKKLKDSIMEKQLLVIEQLSNLKDPSAIKAYTTKYLPPIKKNLDYAAHESTKPAAALVCLTSAKERVTELLAKVNELAAEQSMVAPPKPEQELSANAKDDPMDTDVKVIDAVFNGPTLGFAVPEPVEIEARPKRKRSDSDDGPEVGKKRRADPAKPLKDLCHSFGPMGDGKLWMTLPEGKEPTFVVGEAFLLDDGTTAYVTTLTRLASSDAQETMWTINFVCFDD